MTIEVVKEVKDVSLVRQGAAYSVVRYDEDRHQWVSVGCHKDGSQNVCGGGYYSEAAMAYAAIWMSQRAARRLMREVTA